MAFYSVGVPWFSSATSWSSSSPCSTSLQSRLLYNLSLICYAGKLFMMLATISLATATMLFVASIMEEEESALLISRKTSPKLWQLICLVLEGRILTWFFIFHCSLAVHFVAKYFMEPIRIKWVSFLPPATRSLKPWYSTLERLYFSGKSFHVLTFTITFPFLSTLMSLVRTRIFIQASSGIPKRYASESRPPPIIS